MLLEVYKTYAGDESAEAIKDDFRGTNLITQIELAQGAAAHTPCVQLAARVRRTFPGFINIMINPAPHAYGRVTDLEIKQQQMRSLRHYADGFVLGAATPDGTLDEEALAILMNTAKGLPVTFLLDQIKQEHWNATLNRLLDYGVSSVLSSGEYGGKGRVANTIDTLCALADKCRLRGMGLMARGGISIKEFEDLELRKKLFLLPAIHARFHDPASGSDRYSNDIMRKIGTSLETAGVTAIYPALRQSLGDFVPFRHSLDRGLYIKRSGVPIMGNDPH